ncbi:FMN reductase [Moraxellaceae bacterium AER2_44_116]|nr:FMN reductase [Moraxellaceae bacterium AER2_44_116]
MSIVGVSGGLSSPSRTYGLVQAIINELNDVSPQQGTLIDFASVATAFGSVLSREQLNFEQEALLQRIEAADILVVAVPVYRAAYPGLFKHLFDLVERDALERKVVILAANGGSAHHALIIESHLRPLFSSLGAYTVPTGIYSQTSDFTNYQLTSQSVLERVREAVDEAIQLRSRLFHAVEHKGLVNAKYAA